MDNVEYLTSLKDSLMKYEQDTSGHFFDLAYSEHFQQSNPAQNKIIEQLSEIFYRTQVRPLDVIEHEFQRSFWELAKQRKAMQLDASTACYSASLAIEIVANFLRKKQFRTALIEPTFDNLPAILRRNGIELTSINESEIFPVVNLELLLSLDVDAIFIVMPNNPTGQWLNQAQLGAIAHFCAEHRKLLIVDFCLRFFVNLMDWDQYGTALDSGCDFIFIEDTGKTWPLLGLKTALLTTNPRIFKEVHRIKSEFLLNVSPFVLEILRQHIVNSNELTFKIMDTIQTNRGYLRSQLANTMLRPVYPDSSITFEWLKIIDKHDDRQIWEILGRKGVYTLPGSLFFWDTPMKGNKNLRLAVVRDPLLFRSAVDTLVSALATFESHN